ncbi:ABC-type amino acid transport substrate-binding protein [Paenibacillus sp. RC254]|uniref:transporter substrate-binding domain-containing protein n=1 Tax=unclassified Paenibacillus TaxID=185978 RepID=UPI0024B99F4B|nr:MULTISPECIES: transporter substrate-binding domain-containing protein [unclassified Paenibacillus]
MKLNTSMHTVKMAGLLLLVLLTACGQNTTAQSTNAKAGREAATQPETVTTLLVGTGGTTKPFTFSNDQDELDGYDIALLKAVDELLPQYEIKFERVKFDGIFSGIDAGRYQIGANSISKKPEREEKYLFSSEPYGYASTVIVKRKNEDTLKSLDDLGGKRAIVTTDGSANDNFIEAFNKEHPDNPIQITYADLEDVQVYQKIENNELDFKLHGLSSYKEIVDEFGFKNLDKVTLPLEQAKRISDPGVYFIFPKTDKGAEIRTAVDGALATLRADGTLSRLAVQYFDTDISKGTAE